MSKKLISIALALLLVLMLGVPVFAASEEPAVVPDESVIFPEESVVLPDESLAVPDESAIVPDESVVLPDESAVVPVESVVAPEESATVVAPVSEVAATSADSQIGTRAMYIREFVGFDTSFQHRNLKYTSLGGMVARNDSPYNMFPAYTYQSSGTVTASLGISAGLTAEASAIVAGVGISLGVTGTMSRSWTRGMTAGASVQLPPGGSVTITGYIPGLTAAGSLKYKVYMDGYPSNWWYEYTPVSGIYIPEANTIYIEAS